jgi:RNA polymerase sigma factor (sigma-70 family)
MATHGLQRTLDRIRVSLAPDLPDELLLRAFIDARDETAFASLVRRHGRMVLEVSRRILGNVHDAEDVFQATFLVLAQKARSVADRDAVGCWLYKVTYRIALKAKIAIDRRRRKEMQVNVMREPCTAAPKVRDWEVFLDEELCRLPAKYRLPIILCDLEGRTRKEVERQLRLAEGTLSSRLATARRLLAERLTRRGLVLTPGVLATSLSQASAYVPLDLAVATARKAVLVAAGQMAALTNSVTILRTGSRC